MFDLENLAAAHPIVDVGKLDDLVDDRQRAAFFRFERHATSVWPWDDALRTARLWITCGA